MKIGNIGFSCILKDEIKSIKDGKSNSQLGLYHSPEALETDCDLFKPWFDIW